MSLRIGRRGFLQVSTTGAVVLASGTVLAGCAGGSFDHGVASGDPTCDSVVIWTRVTPSENVEVPVVWELARDEAFKRRVAVGVVKTDATVDYTVKVDVSGLAPGQTYYYRFRNASQLSPVGRTRTLPLQNVESARVAVVSCAHYAQGYFHVYRELAAQDGVDFVLHLGDYIYEVGSSSTAVRPLEPVNETLTLNDYRQRYAYYRRDLDLQAAHARHPFVLVWDDHEVVNNAWQDGALGHGATEVDYLARRQAAIQAYCEWLPVREPVDGERRRIYRSVQVGELLSLHLLDTRHYARERALDYRDYVNPQNGVLDAPRFFADLEAPRALLGEEQRVWLTEQLSSSATWQLLGQQVLSARMWLPAAVALRQLTFAQYAALKALAETNPEALTATQRRLLAAPLVPYNLDAWDGYPSEQRWLFDTAQQLDVNLVVLAGDTHNAWASDLLATDGEHAGVEFATSSVSSRGLEELLAPQDPEAVAGGALSAIATLRYAETAHRGYMLLDITHEQVVATWRFVDSAKTPEYQPLTEREHKLCVRPGLAERRVRPVT